MLDITSALSRAVSDAFEECGYAREYGAVRVSDRPDLCEYQCNGALAAAKAFHKAPFMIADEVVAKLAEKSADILTAESVKPGFININLAGGFIAEGLNEMAGDDRLGAPLAAKIKKIVIDYGGPNVAKPLHVGHLRSAVIGESVKRILRFAGHEVLGDIHLGDWGLQMGLIITEMKERHPEWPYFNENAGDGGQGYPEEAPFTISDLEEIYPCASKKSSDNPDYKAAAMEATHLLQEGKPGYRALWQAIMQVSLADLKKNYARLDVDFDLWKGESDVQDVMPGMIEDMVSRGIAYEDDGALVVDVKEEGDKKEIPPCIIRKSDGAALYSTTDLATIKQRMELYSPDSIIYVVDKRQAMHFTQVFRTARKAGLVNDATELRHIGFGTVNGKDGHAFKTREGGVLRLGTLLDMVEEEMAAKIAENRNVREEDAAETARIVSLSAVKYGDLSNQAAKDYVFDVSKFASFEGNTGPYILYTLVRIKSVLEKAGEGASGKIAAPAGKAEKELALQLSRFGEMFAEAAEEMAPHKVCAYVYSLANGFNRFYHDTKILGEEDETRRGSYLAMLSLSEKVFEKCIGLLGFEWVRRM